MHTAIIGAGAAGFFLAISLKERCPEMDITIFERSQHPLRKVKVSGGGRCNCTNTFEDVIDLSSVYPRGHRLMKRLLKAFSERDAYRWFEEHGVPLTVQPDHCVFPAAQDSQVIIDCFLRYAKKLGIQIKTACPIQSITPSTSSSQIPSIPSSQIPSPPSPQTLSAPSPQVLSAPSPQVLSAPSPQTSATPSSPLVCAKVLPSRQPLTLHHSAGTEAFDFVVLTTGGQPRIDNLRWLANLGHTIESPVPSLFTFSIEDAELRALMGTVVEPATVSIPATKFRATGPLLITHWGMSGPAILKLSSYAARHLAEQGYQSPILVNWTGMNEEEARKHLKNIFAQHTNKQVDSVHPFNLPSRLWAYLVRRALFPVSQQNSTPLNSVDRPAQPSGVSAEMTCGDCSGRILNRLVATLTADNYAIASRAPFKDEFVTCGGIALNAVNPSTLESRSVPNLFFAGELLDIDGITGGFNFQAAWTTAHTVATAITRKIAEETAVK